VHHAGMQIFSRISEKVYRRKLFRLIR